MCEPLYGAIFDMDGVVAITTTRTRQELVQADRVIDRFTEVTASDLVRLISQTRS